MIMKKKKGRPGPLLGQCLVAAAAATWVAAAALDEIERLATGTLPGPGMPHKGEALLSQLLVAPMWDAMPVPLPTAKPTPLGNLDVL